MYKLVSARTNFYVLKYNDSVVFYYPKYKLPKSFNNWERLEYVKSKFEQLYGEAC